MRVVTVVCLSSVLALAGHAHPAAQPVRPNGNANGAATPPITGTIKAAMRDLSAPDAATRLRAARTLGRLAEWGGTRPVARTPGDGGATAQGATASADWYQQFRPAVAPLLSLLLVEQDARTRAEAVWALGTFRSEALTGAPLIARFLKDRAIPPALRQYAPVALARVEGAASVRIITDALRNERHDRLMASACLFALSLTGAAGVPVLIEVLGGDDALLRAWSADALAALGPAAAPARASLEQRLRDDSHPAVRMAALTALTRIVPAVIDIEPVLTAIIANTAEPAAMCDVASRALSRSSAASRPRQADCARHRAPGANADSGVRDESLSALRGAFELPAQVAAEGSRISGWDAEATQQYVFACIDSGERPTDLLKERAAKPEREGRLTLVGVRVTAGGAVLDTRRGEVDTGAHAYSCTGLRIDKPRDPTRWPVARIDYKTYDGSAGARQIGWTAVIDGESMEVLHRDRAATRAEPPTRRSR